jgi:hypothetical protein
MWLWLFRFKVKESGSKTRKYRNKRDSPQRSRDHSRDDKGRRSPGLASPENRERKSREVVRFERDGKSVVRVERKTKHGREEQPPWNKQIRGNNWKPKKKTWEESDDESSDDDPRGGRPAFRAYRR